MSIRVDRDNKILEELRIESKRHASFKDAISENQRLESLTSENKKLREDVEKLQNKVRDLITKNFELKRANLDLDFANQLLIQQKKLKEDLDDFKFKRELEQIFG